MKFDLGTEVEPLEYDFTTMPGRPEILADAKGIIPEPSRELVDRFMTKFFSLQELLVSIHGEPEKPAADDAEQDQTDEMVTVMARLEQWREGDPKSARELEEARQGMLDMVSEVCQGRPAREQLAAIGHRGLTLFSAWLMRELSNPKGTTASATTASPEGQTSV